MMEYLARVLGCNATQAFQVPTQAFQAFQALIFALIFALIGGNSHN